MKKTLLMIIIILGIIINFQTSLQGITPIESVQNGITVHNGNTVQPISLDVYFSEGGIWTYVNTYHVPAGGSIFISTGTLHSFNYGYKAPSGYIVAFYSNQITLF